MSLEDKIKQAEAKVAKMCSIWQGIMSNRNIPVARRDKVRLAYIKAKEELAALQAQLIEE